MTSMPELDPVVRLTARRVWALVAAVLLVLTGAAVWATSVHIDSTVDLHGILVAGDGPQLLAAPADARVVASLVSPGQSVWAGVPVARLATATGPVTVWSWTSGVVSAVLAGPGQSVGAGAPLVAVDHIGAPLHAVLLGSTLASVPVGAVVRGPGYVGRVIGSAPYAVTVGQLAGQYGLTDLPGDTDRAGLVRPVVVDLGRSAWVGATGTPVTLAVVIARQRPVDVLLHGGAL